MTYSTILGTGGYLPEKILTNKELEKIMDTTDEWIVDRTGISERRIASETDTVLSMAENAAKQAISASNVMAAEIDMIIMATTMPEKMFPSTSCLLQKKLNVKKYCPVIDLNSAACAGFMYAISIADHYIRLGSMKNILVIGSEIMSRVVDWSDRGTCILFGDGAGALVLGASEKPGILSTHLHADGTHQDVLSLNASIGKPAEVEVEKALYIKMAGNQLFKLAVNILGDLFDETLMANGLQKSDIDWLVPHQANIRIIQAMARKLALPMERVAITLDKQGNTSSASIPLALDEAIRAGKIKRGELLLLEGLGGGLTWGSALIKY